GKDPYFLYAASNWGSMVALFAYPFLIEPILPLKYYAATEAGQTYVWLSQSWLWALGYLIFAILVTICALVVSRAQSRRRDSVEDPLPQFEADLPDERPRLATQLRWVALAFVPSSLMLGVTTHITLDIAAIPLIWVV